MLRSTFFLLLVTMAAACAPVVGDPCQTDAECGTSLVCDSVTTAEGYCTRSPCRAGECPVEAVCVDFGSESTWCMRSCSDGQECREGLTCRTDAKVLDPAAAGDTPAFCGVAPVAP